MGYEKKFILVRLPPQGTAGAPHNNLGWFTGPGSKYCKRSQDPLNYCKVHARMHKMSTPGKTNGGAAAEGRCSPFVYLAFGARGILA